MSRYGGRGSSPVPLECKVYVGNLPSGASRTELEDSFSRYGRVKNVWVARNPPGFAFVMFEDRRDAADACEALDDRSICGARVRVEMSTGESRRSRDRGYRGGGGYMGGRRGMRENDKCYECGQRGHFARDCDRRGRSPGGYRSKHYSRSYSRSRSRSPRRRFSRSPPKYRSNSRSRSRSRSRS